MAYRWTVTVTIPTEAGGASLSPANDFLGGAKAMAVIMPATWVNVNISFQASNAIDGTFYDVYDEAGNEVTATVKQNKMQSLQALAPILSQFRYVKVRSGVTGAHTDQTASRTLTFIFQR
jgi:hypothetical protein